MKKIRYAILALVTLVAAACSTKEFDEITELNLTRCLSPMDLNARVSATLGDVVTFSWAVSKDADAYILTVYTDKDLTQEYLRETVLPSQVPYQKKLEADKTYWFTLQATAEGKADSHVVTNGRNFKTFAVKDNLFVKVSDRTSTSVSLVWSKEVADYAEVDRIEYALPGEDPAGSVALSASDIEAASATVDGLTPSTEYVFTLYYLSASRGQVDAWTTPDINGTTEVSSTDALLNAVKTAGAKILLKMEGSPYDIEALDISNGFTLLGEESADGTKPVVQGEFHFADTWTPGTGLYFEGVDFDGAPTAASPSGFGFAIQNKNGGAVEGKEIGNITYKNCVITNFSKGLIYEWGKKMVLGDVLYDSCDINKINADGSGGGDVFDIRGASTVQSLKFVNNTISQGMRSFIRFDAGTLGALVFDNNTCWNLTVSDNANNAGIFALQIAAASASFKNNLFLEMTAEKAILGSSATSKDTPTGFKYMRPEDLSLSASNNWYFQVVETYFTENWSAAKTGFSELSDNPCHNAAGGYFNLNPDSVIAGKGVGASKWWTPFVEEPEDLTQGVLDGAHTWDLSNARYFAGTIKKSMVRDGLLIVASENNPVVAENGTLSFLNAAVTNRQKVPADGYVAFKVNTPGSVVLRAAGEGDAHLVVATQPVAGGDLIVKGGVAPVADAPATQKIPVSDITEESWVYVYPSGPMALAQLAWSMDLTKVNTALPAPDPKAAPAAFTAGEATEVTISWDAVENAGSYSVVFSGKTYAVDGLEYTIEGKTTSMLDAGSYTVKVYANPTDKDIYNTQSEAGVAAFAVLPAGGGESSDEFIVSSVEELLTAIEAGKDAITLKYSDVPYEVGKLTLNAPLHLKGQTSDGKKTAVNASFTLSGPIGGSVVLSNLDITSTDNGSAVSVLIDDKANAPVADTVAIYDSNLHGTKALYDNSGKATSQVQYVIFKGNFISKCSEGADFIDMRAGAHHNFIFENNTVAESCRTFVRTDAGHEMNSAVIRNNTFYKVATNSSSKDNNGILHIRSAAGAGLNDYRVENNFFYSILMDADNLPSNANGFPKFKSGGGLVPNVIRNNYFFNCEDREEFAAYSFWKNLSKEDATVGGGAILPADPCKNAASYDFTLTNGVMMNAGVGDPRWNAMAGSTPSSEIAVSDLEGLLTAISAGKQAITLEPGTYDLTAVEAGTVDEVASGKITLVTPLNIIGKPGAVFKGGFIFKAGVNAFSIRNVKLDGASTVDNVFEVADAAVAMSSFALKDCEVTAYKNRLFYMNVTGSVTSAEFSGNVVTGVSGADFTSGDFIDVRKGTLTALRVTNNTFANAIRTFARIDAAVVCSNILVQHNTFYHNCYVDSKDNNGIFHVRSTTVTSANQVIVKDNLFVNMHRANATPGQGQGFPKLVSKASSAIALPVFNHNYFADVETTENNTDAEYSWWAYSPQAAATAGNGVILTADVFKDAAGGDFTVVHKLVASEGVGDPRWIKSAPAAGEAFTVTNIEEFATAISAGKQVIALQGESFDLSAVEGASAGTITLSQGLTVKGVSRNGRKPELVGGFKLEATEGSLVLENLRLNGTYKEGTEDKKVADMLVLNASAVMDEIVLTGCEVYGYANRMVSGPNETTLGALKLSGLLVHDFGTSGDFIDFRKGVISEISIVGNTFYNGIRTFLRVDAGVNCGAVTVQNNTFYNLCSVDSKDNNGIFHVRSSSAVVAPAPGRRSMDNAARRILVTRNLFAAMHRAVETPSQANGFPKLVSTASEKIKHPYITDNLFFDIDTAEGYSWWNTMTAEDIEAAGTVLAETPFSGDPATGKFTVKGAYKGYGDTRW